MSFDSHRNPEKYVSTPHQYIAPIETEQEDPVCDCGDLSSMHVDGCEQCAVIGCGCREFSNESEE